MMGKKSRTGMLLLLLFACTLLPAYSQGIRGVVRDVNGNPVPYAAIFIKELTRGTTCNAMGQFSLPLPAGQYTVFFRSMGYSEVSRSLDIGAVFTELDVALPPQTYMIPEVRVSASGEDPAYWIMRKTIGLANYHLNEVSRYEAEIYIKGTVILDKLPKAIAKRMEVNEIKVKEDEAYMLESMNVVNFRAPDKYDMEIIASQNTLPGYTDNVNPMDYVNASLYQDQIENVISPLARNAFSHYRFSFEGTFMEGTRIINKIRVTPKRKSQQLVEGSLFIVEDLWCLHSSDLKLKTIAGTISLQQLYANVMMDAWLPVSHKIQAQIEIVGVKGKATYVSSLEYRDVSLNPNLPKSYFEAVNTQEESGEEVVEEVLSTEQEKINELLQKEELNNREMARLSKLMEKETEKATSQDNEESLNQTGTSFSVADDAVKNDSIYWKERRPIPLTPEEQVTLKERDSIMGLGGPDLPKDSLPEVRPNRRPLRNLVLGKTYTKARGKLRIRHGGLLDLDEFSYNTVDGIRYGQYLSLDWRPDSLYALRSWLHAGYNFHRHAPQISWHSDLLYAPMHRGKVALYLDWASADFNASSGISEITNTAYTLDVRRNYLKLYEERNATLYNRIDPINGFQVVTSLSYGKRLPLENNSLFSFFYRNASEERFTENTPADLPASHPDLQEQQRLLALVELEYTPKRYYVIRNHRKNYRDSRWPTLRLAYQQSIPLEESGWSDFKKLEAGLRHHFQVGLLARMDWSLNGGIFLDTTSMHFSDRRHFKSYPLYLDLAGLDGGLMFTDYYQTSTKEWWLQVNGTLSSTYLFLKFLPWVSERLWTESIHLGYLHQPSLHHYLQLGYSLNEIFFLMDLGVFVGFYEGGSGNGGNWGYRNITVRLNFRF